MGILLLPIDTMQSNGALCLVRDLADLLYSRSSCCMICSSKSAASPAGTGRKKMKNSMPSSTNCSLIIFWLAFMVGNTNP